MDEHSPPAAAPDAAYLRLGDVVEERRKSLDYKQDELPHGPSSTTVSQIERGEPAGNLAYKRLEQSLEWERGSVQAVLAGNEPRPILAGSPPARPTEIHVTKDDLAAMEQAQAYLTAWEAVLHVTRRNVTGESKNFSPESAIALAIASADQLTDQVLNSKAGPSVRPVLQRLFLDKQELQLHGFRNIDYWANPGHNTSMEVHDELEIKTQSDASRETQQGEEVLPDRPKRPPYGGLGRKKAREDGAD